MDIIELYVRATTNEAEYERELRNLRAKILDLRTSVKAAFAVMPNVVKTAFQTSLQTVKNFGVTAGNFLKKAMLGAMLLLGLSLGRIIASLRESFNELVNIRGGKLAENIAAIQGPFTELRAAIANAFLPLIELAIPYIKMALEWLVQLFNRVAMITAAFAGQKQVLQVVVGSAAKYAKNTKDAEKAAKGALAAFDQINVLQRETAAQEETTPKTFDAEMVPITDDILKKVREIKDEIAAWFADPIGKLRETWSKVSDWFGENVAKPIAAWWNKTLVGQEVNGAVEKFRGLFQSLSGVIANDNLTTAEKFKEAWVLVADFFKTNVINPLIESIVFWAAVARLKWQEFVNWFKLNIATPIQEAFGMALDWVERKFREIFAKVQNFVQTTVDNILASITRMVNGILEGFAAITGLQTPALPNVGGATATVPHLATGAVIPPNAAFTAVLGDNKRETEVVSPLSTIRQAVLEALSASEQTMNVTVLLDGEPIYRNQEKYRRIKGPNLISGGVTS